MPIKPFVENAGDEDQVRRGAQKERTKETRESEDLRFVLSSAQGRRFYWRLLAHCGPLSEPTDSDPYRTYYNNGRAGVGRFLIAEMEQADPSAWQKMRLEALKEEEKYG